MLLPLPKLVAQIATNPLPLPPLVLPGIKAVSVPVYVEPKPVRKAQLDGDVAQGYVQVLTDVPDDAHAYVLMVSRGVKFLACDADTLVPANGVISISKRPDCDGVRYVWRG